MPLYDYQCEKCQTVFEARATFKEKQDGLKPQCPECQSKKTRQILTSGLYPGAHPRWTLWSLRPELRSRLLRLIK